MAMNFKNFKADNIGKVFVGGLAPHTSSESLKQHFLSNYGAAPEAKVMTTTDQTTGEVRSKGYAFVKFDEPSIIDSIVGVGSFQAWLTIDGKNCEVKRIDENISNSNTGTSNNYYETPAGPPLDPQRAELESRKIFVGGLPDTTTNEKLMEYFRSTVDPGVVDANAMIDAATGKTRGFGYVTFSHKASVAKALQLKDDHYIDGKWIDVKQSVAPGQPKHELAGGKGKGKGKGPAGGKGAYGKDNGYGTLPAYGAAPGGGKGYGTLPTYGAAPGGKGKDKGKGQKTNGTAPPYAAVAPAPYGYPAPGQGYGVTHPPYGAPPQGQYGAPPQGQYGAPPQGQYGAPPQGQYGAPPQGQYGAPPQGQYGAPPQGQGYMAAPPPMTMPAEPPPQMPSNNLYVKGLPPEVTETFLNEIFAQYGMVTQLKVLPRDASKAEVAAMIRMGSVEEAQWLVDNLNGNIPQGMTTPVTVKFANSHPKGGKGSKF